MISQLQQRNGLIYKRYISGAIEYSSIHVIIAHSLLTRRLKNKLSLCIISSLRVLPVYKTNCLCSILFWDIFLDLYMSIYGNISSDYPLKTGFTVFNFFYDQHIMKMNYQNPRVLHLVLVIRLYLMLHILCRHEWILIFAICLASSVYYKTL